MKNIVEKIDGILGNYLDEATEKQRDSLKTKITSLQGKIKQMEQKLKGLKGDQLKKAREAVQKERDTLADLKDDYENTDAAGYFGFDDEKEPGGSKHNPKYHGGSL